MAVGTPNPERLSDVIARELERIYCECVEQEPPINPARTCSQCGMFIGFDSCNDCVDWIESMKIPEHERKAKP